MSVEECGQNFRKFLRSFKRKYRLREDDRFAAPGEGEELIYQDMLGQMLALGTTNLNLDVKNLKSFPATKKFYHQLHMYPQEIIPIMDTALKDELLEYLVSIGAPNEDYDKCLARNYKVRPFNVEKSINMRDLNPADIDKIVRIKGLVIRVSSIIPDMGTGTAMIQAKPRFENRVLTINSIFPLPCLRAYRDCRHRPRQDRRAHRVST